MSSRQDDHLAELSDAARRAGSIVTEYINSIVDAAERRADEIRQTADRDAELTRQEALASAQRVFDRINALEGPLTELVQTLRVETDRVGRELEGHVDGEAIGIAARAEIAAEAAEAGAAAEAAEAGDAAEAEGAGDQVGPISASRSEWEQARIRVPAPSWERELEPEPHSEQGLPVGDEPRSEREIPLEEERAIEVAEPAMTTGDPPAAKPVERAPSWAVPVVPEEPSPAAELPAIRTPEPVVRPPEPAVRPPETTARPPQPAVRPPIPSRTAEKPTSWIRSLFRGRTSQTVFITTRGHCAVCQRTFIAGTEENLRLSGWRVSGDVGLCPECRSEDWQLPEGARLPVRQGGG